MIARSLFSCSLAMALTVGTSTAQVSRFQIDAQYRGAVKKSFSSIGQAGLKWVPGADGTVRVNGEGRVNHPKERSKVYEFGLDMQFRVTGDSIQYLASRNTCNAGSEGLKSRIERILPFVYLVASVPVNGSRAPRLFRTPHGEYRMRYGETSNHVEVTVEERNSQIGKFFLAKDAGTLYLERFRIPAKDNVVISFVAQ